MISVALEQFKNKNQSSIRKPKARLCSRGNTKFGCDNIKPIIYHKPSYGIRAEELYYAEDKLDNF